MYVSLTLNAKAAQPRLIRKGTLLEKNNSSSHICAYVMDLLKDTTLRTYFQMQLCECSCATENTD